MKLALIGAGNRITFQYALNLEKNYSNQVEMVGVYDSNLTRSKALSQRLNKPIPVYDNVDRLLSQSGCDTVLIGTLDATHDFYIDKAMRLGLDVICEKPITTTVEKAKIILKAEEESQ